MADYEPTGRAGAAIAAMRADPDPRRIWSSKQLAEVMEGDVTICGSSMAAPLKHGIVHHRGNQWGRSEWSLTPFDAPQAAIAGPTTGNGWRPPEMVAPRAGSDVRLPKTAAVSPGELELTAWGASLLAEVKGDVEVGPGTPAVFAQPEPEAAENEQPTEPDAWFSARTGCVVLTGIELDEDGSITLLPQLVRAIVRMAREGVR